MAVIPTPAALSPWPATTAAVTWKAATARLRKELYPKTGATADPDCPDDLDQQVAQLGAVASVRVQQYAPQAPQAIRDEAVIRFAGYLASRPKPIRALDMGNTRVEFATAGLSRPFVYSGARALLDPFRRRRALAAVSSS